MVLMHDVGARDGATPEILTDKAMIHVFHDMAVLLQMFHSV